MINGNLLNIKSFINHKMRQPHAELKKIIVFQTIKLNKFSTYKTTDKTHTLFIKNTDITPPF